MVESMLHTETDVTPWWCDTSDKNAGLPGPGDCHGAGAAEEGARLGLLEALHGGVHASTQD